MNCILFEDYDKKFKSETLKGIENNINILKNIYEEIYMNEYGFVYCIDNLSKNDCRILCKTNLNEYLQVPEGTILKINSKSISDCLKSGKTKILGFYVNENYELIFKTETCDFNVGNYEYDKKLNIEYLNELCNNVNYTCDLSELLDRFDNKEFVNIKKGKYDLILTHKLFPMINKSVYFNFSAKDNDDGTFYGIFNNKIETKNKKGETTFEMEVMYMYRFMDLN